MKKLLSIILAGILVISMAACGSSGQDDVAETDNTTETEEVSAAEEDSMVSGEADESAAENETAEEAGTETAESETAESEETAEDTQNILIAYFSWSGNTEELAGMIQDETGGDLFEIEPAEPYTEDYDALLDQARQEQQENVRPELAGQVENWDGYDVIFVGYPNWWSDAPMAVLSFLEGYDCTGKTIVPFNTSGGGGFGDSLASIEESAAGATVLEGFSVDGDSVSNAQADVSEWISGLGLVQ